MRYFSMAFKNLLSHWQHHQILVNPHEQHQKLVKSLATSIKTCQSLKTKLKTCLLTASARVAQVIQGSQLGTKIIPTRTVGFMVD